jgi:hypothetical protein
MNSLSERAAYHEARQLRRHSLTPFRSSTSPSRTTRGICTVEIIGNEPTSRWNAWSRFAWRGQRRSGPITEVLIAPIAKWRGTISRVSSTRRKVGRLISMPVEGAHHRRLRLFSKRKIARDKLQCATSRIEFARRNTKSCAFHKPPSPAAAQLRSLTLK